nr:circularly permuted type 2 ATP-grasp protein [Tumebacillus amylolyticus]
MIEEVNDRVSGDPQPARTAFRELLQTAEQDRFLYAHHRQSLIFPTPVLLEREQYKAIGRDAENLLTLLLSIPKRLFGGDPFVMGRRLGFSEEQCQVMSLTFGDDAGIMARADLSLNETGYQCMEFNVDSSVGGIEIARLNSFMEEMRYFRTLGSEHWRYDDPFRHLVDSIRAVAEIKGLHLEKSRIAIVDWYPDMLDYAEMNAYTQKLFREHGLDVWVCHQDEVELVDESLMCRGEVIDIMYRTFLFADVKRDTDKVMQMLKAYEAGNLVVINGLHTELYSNKGNFALLSDPAFASHYSPEEQDLIQRCIPWTRFLESGLEQVVTENREQLVLKPAYGYGGHGVLLGWKLSQSEWESKVRDLLGGTETYVVQKRIMEDPVKVPMMQGEELVFEDVIMNVGAFVFNQSFAGLMVRSMPAGGHGVINVAQGAGFACAFYRDEL